MNDAMHLPVLKLLIVISNWDKAEKVNEVIKKYPVQMHFQSKAEGTASSALLDMFGLGSTDKSLMHCLIPQTIAGDLMDNLARELQINQKGKGVAFLLSLSGIGMSFLHKLTDEAKEEVLSKLKNMERAVNKMGNEINHNLIYAIINQGHSEDLMEAARSAGATGGTVIRARRTEEDEKSVFFGYGTQGEREIVLVLAKKETKSAIMRAMSEKCGIKSEAKGIIFSLPVDEVIGLQQ